MPDLTKPALAWTLQWDADWVTAVAFLGNNPVAAGDDGGHVIVWDREAGTVTRRWQVKGWAYALALAPDKRQACVGERFPVVFDSGRHAGLRLWDATTGEVFKDLSAEFKGQFTAAA